MAQRGLDVPFVNRTRDFAAARTTLHNQHQFESLPPQWVDSVDALEYILSTLRSRIETLEQSRLSDAQLSHQKSTIESITAGFRKLYASLDDFGKKNGKDRVAMAASTKVRLEAQELYKRFQPTQARIVRWHESKEEQRHIVPAHEDLEINMQLDSAEQQRHQDILALTNSIKEVHDIFMQLSNMVASQDELVNRIDVHVERTLEHIQHANKDSLEPAEQSSRVKGAWICILILAVCIVVLVGAVTFKYT